MARLAMNASLRCHLAKRRPSMVFGQAISGRHVVFEVGQESSLRTRGGSFVAVGSLAGWRRDARSENFLMSRERESVTGLPAVI